MAGVADGNGDGEDEREGEAADFGSSANPKPTSRKLANTQTLNSIAANDGDITTPREFWLASCLAEAEDKAHKESVLIRATVIRFRKPVEPAQAIRSDSLYLLITITFLPRLCGRFVVTALRRLFAFLANICATF